jgi:hypothetical protein
MHSFANSFTRTFSPTVCSTSNHGAAILTLRLAERALLDRLPRVKGARWDHVDHPICLKGTRIEELEKLAKWMDDEGERRMYVLTGMAGTGKTTIAKSAAELAHEKGVLGASFFCSRASDERSNSRLICPTIAFQLSRYSTEFGAEVVKTIMKDPDIGHSLFDKQLEELIVKPMRRAVTSIVASFKMKLGFSRSLSDQQLKQLILRPLRLLATSVDTDPDLAQLFPDVQQMVIIPLQSIAISLREEKGKEEEWDLVVDEIISIVEAIEEGLPAGRVQESIIKPVCKVVASMEEALKVVAKRKDHTRPDYTQETRARLSEKLARSVTRLRAIISLVEHRLSEEFRKSIVEPARKIIASVQKHDTGHILTDEGFRDQVVEPVRRVIASGLTQDASLSPSDSLLKKRIEELLHTIVSSLQEKLDATLWLSDAQLDDVVLRPLRTLVEVANSSPLAKQFKTRRQVAMELENVISFAVKSGNPLSDEELEASITEFLQKMKPFARPVIIVVDALDECKDLGTPEKFLLAFARHIHSIPSLKIFATSRPEFSARLALQDSSVKRLTDVLILHEVDRLRVDADMRLFFRVHLAAIAAKRRYDYTDLPDTWPPEELVEKLARKAAGFFIFAFTICRFLDSPGDIQEQLEFILEFSTNTEGRLGIDGLYQSVFDTALSHFLDHRLAAQCGFVVAAIVLLFDPLSLEDLAGVLGIGPDRIRGILRDLHSVLVVPLNNKGIIHTFHASFHDFLTDRTRCSSQIHVHLPRRHMEITICLLQRMMEGLRKNICKFDGFKQNGEVAYLNERRARYIGKPLTYACRYWAQHLSHVPPTESGNEVLAQRLDRFLQTKLLYWIEALSLMGDMATAETSLATVRRWFSVWLQATEQSLMLILCVAGSQDVATADSQQSSRRRQSIFDPVW